MPGEPLAKLPLCRVEKLAARELDGWSHDGTCLLFRDRELRAIEVATGKTRLLTPYARGADLSPDFSTVAMGGWEEKGTHTVRFFDVKRPHSAPLRTLQGAGPQCTFVAFSPDGKRLWSSGHDGLGHLWDLASGELLAPAATMPGLRQGCWTSDGSAVCGFVPGGKQLVVALVDLAG